MLRPKGGARAPTAGAGAASDKASDTEVVGLVTMHGAGDVLILGVAHANGHIHAYNAATGQWRQQLKVAPNVSDLLAAPRCVVIAKVLLLLP